MKRPTNEKTMKGKKNMEYGREEVIMQFWQGVIPVEQLFGQQTCKLSRQTLFI